MNTDTRVDLELKILRSISHAIPSVRGFGKLSGWLRDFYCRKKRPYVTSKVFGYDISLNPNDWVESEFIFHPHQFDRYEINYMKNNLNPGDTFLDAGAHLGFYSLAASHLVGEKGKIIAIEANPKTYERGRDIIDKHQISNIQLVNVGLSNTEETLELSINEGNSGASSFLNAQGSQSTKVACLPLLEVLNQNNVTSIKGAKFDLEGFEFKVLKHFFENATKHLFPQFIFIEHFREWNERAGGDVIELLHKHGYKTAWHLAHRHNYIMRKL